MRIKILTSWILLISITLNVLGSEKDTFVFPPIPPKVATNVAQLSKLICQDATTDRERANIIFYWVTHNIAWDVKTFNKETNIKYRKPEDVLKKKIGYPKDYANLIKAMCESIGIRTQVIMGYERSFLHDEGASFYMPNHVWNAILVENRWRIVDAFSAAGKNTYDLNWFKRIKQSINKKKIYTSTKFKFIPDYDPSFFLQDPENVRLTRLPADPIWQLTDTIMPLAVFEKSEEDIRNFNERFSNPQQDYAKLTEVNNLNDDDAILECADRTYAFNPRFTAMKASKHQALANKELKKMNLAKSKAEAKTIVEKTKVELNLAKDILSEQKQQITKEYAELRKINLEKRTDVNKFKQSFSSINNKYITESKSKMNNADSKIPSLKSDATAKAKKENEVNKAEFAKIKTIKPEQSPTSTEILKLKDSIDKRTKKIVQQEDNTLNEKTRIAEMKASMEGCLDELVNYINLSDSALMREASARSRKQDSYSDSIRMIRSDLNYYKATKVDSLQQAYFDQYDSIVVHYEATKKLYSNTIDASKNNVKNIESIKKLNNTDVTLASQHNDNVEKYQNAIRGYVNHSISYINFLKSQKEMISKLLNVYERENKFFSSLSGREDKRKDLIKKLIDKEEKLSKKHNDQRYDNVTSLKKELDEGFKKATKPAKPSKKTKSKK